MPHSKECEFASPATLGRWEPGRLGWLRDVEQQWAARARQHRLRELDAGYVPYMPFSLAQFITYLAEAIEVAPGWKFLDVGCGPGTKIWLAQAMFGLDGAGIDIIPAFVEAAREQLGVDAEVANARVYDYRDEDIVFCNRPCNGDALAALEKRITATMRPGAVLILVNGHSAPDWQIVSVEHTGPGPVQGVWSKPLSAWEEAPHAW